VKITYSLALLKSFWLTIVIIQQTTNKHFTAVQLKLL